MATSYTAVFKISNAAVFSGSLVHIVFFQSSNASAGGYTGTVEQVLTDIFNDVMIDLFGGSFAITTQVSGLYTFYNVSYTGLSLDPETQSSGDICAIAIQDDSGFYNAAKFISAENCTSEGLCPECPECPPSVNPEDAEDCLSCYQQQVDNCASEIVIQGLDDTTTYVISISDPQSGKTYTSTNISDANGEVTLDTADYPAGLFSPYNSPLTLTILQNGQPVTLTYGYVNYSCIDLVVSNQTEI